MPSWEHGAADSQCDRARRLHGLPALTPADWTAEALAVDAAG
jgi:hypothetical protein